MSVVIFAVVIVLMLLVALWIRHGEGGPLIFRAELGEREFPSPHSEEIPPLLSLYSHGVLITYPVRQGPFDGTKLRRVRLRVAVRRTVLDSLKQKPHWSSLWSRRTPTVALQEVRRGALTFWLPVGCRVDPENLYRGFSEVAEAASSRSRPYKGFSYCIRLVPIEMTASPRIVSWTLTNSVEDFGHAINGHPGVRCRVVNDTYAPALTSAVSEPVIDRRDVFKGSQGRRYIVTGRPLLPDENGCSGLEDGDDGGVESQ